MCDIIVTGQRCLVADTGPQPACLHATSFSQPRELSSAELLVYGQVTIIFVVSVCLSQPSDPISIKLGHMLYVWV